MLAKVLVLKILFNLDFVNLHIVPNLGMLSCLSEIYVFKGHKTSVKNMECVLSQIKAFQTLNLLVYV